MTAKIKAALALFVLIGAGCQVKQPEPEVCYPYTLVFSQGDEWRSHDVQRIEENNGLIRVKEHLYPTRSLFRITVNECKETP
jgi:hypothetical protein